MQKSHLYIRTLVGALSVASLITFAANAASAAGPMVPNYARDFREVANDALMYRTGMTSKQADKVLKDSKDAFARCVKENAEKTEGSCLIERDGLSLRFDAAGRKFVYRVEYGHKAGDGYRPNFENDSGAEQTGNQVRVWSGEKSTFFPVYR